MRAAFFFLLALLIFAAFNAIAARALLRIHPRRRRAILAAVVAGNLMWPFMPALQALNAFTRVVRATVGPLWFGWNSFAILYTIFAALVALSWLPFRKRRSFAAFARWPSRVVLATGVVAGIIGFYHAIVPLRIERVPVVLDDLPHGADGTRLVLLSDLHVGLFTRPSRLDKIFATAGALDPAAVLILGDLIDDDPHFVPKLLAGTRSLASSIPLIAVLGNHEMYGDPHRVVAALRGSRIQLGVNSGIPLGALWLACVSDVGAVQMRNHRDLAPDLSKALAGRPPDSYPLVISHQPRIFYEARDKRLPLTLSGHTHGGQCGFRPLRLSLAGLFLEYHMGLYRWGASQLYITTGTGYWLVPFRLGMTPEVTLIELRRRRR